MRRTVILTAGVLIVAAGGLMLLFNSYLSHLQPLLDWGKELTQFASADLEPNTRVGLRVVDGGPNRPVPATTRGGVLLEAHPSAAVWEREGGAAALAVGLARRALLEPRVERRIEWVETRMRRADGATLVMAFERGDGEAIVPLAWPPPEPGGPAGVPGTDGTDGTRPLDASRPAPGVK